MNNFKSFYKSFVDGWHCFTHSKKCASEDKKMRENMSEKQVDRMINDSFPASDPPSTY